MIAPTHHGFAPAQPDAPALPPGPRLPAIVQALHLWRRPIPFFEACSRRFGETFTLRIPTQPPEVLMSAPDAIREIFTASSDLMHAGEATAIVEPILGPRSLLLLDGDRHLRTRRLLMPPFHGARMQAYAGTIRDIAVRAVDAWPVGRSFAFRDAMQEVTLAVIVRVVFGARGEAFERLRDRLARLLAIYTSPVWLMPWMRWEGRWSPWGRALRLRREVHAILSAEFSRRRAEPRTDDDDVLTLLLTARDEDGTPLTDEDLHDQMMTLLFAGHETTATALTWAVARILEHPDVLARLRAELADVVGDGPLAPEHLSRLVYLDATIKETLRLDPIIPDVARRLLRPQRIGGHFLPAGVHVAPSIYLAHRRAAAWPEPDRFDPDRFIDRRPSPYEFLPFGGGDRRCLGMTFALYEMKIVLAEVLHRTELRIAPDYPGGMERRSITLAPSRGLPVTLARRRR